MSVDPRTPTSHSLHRDLARRLVVATLLLSLLISSVAYLTLRERFIELIDAVARVGTVRLNAQLLPLLDSPESLDPAAVQAELDRVAKGKIAQLDQGHYVSVRLLDREGRLLAAVQDNVDSQIGALTKALELRPAPETGSRPELFRMAGRSFTLLSQPLYDSQDRPVLRMVAVFAVSPETVTTYRWQFARTVLLTLGIILVTALLLYPLLRTLLDRVLGLSHSLLLANLDTIRALGSAIAKRDSDTDEHNYRVTLYCVKLAEALNLSREAMCALIKGAFLHDIGKIGIHDHILLKPGRLDAEEFAAMKKHVDYGLDIVRRCRWLEDATEVVGCHHEKFDGNGYPAGLRGEAIPLSARIFAVTDVFDALTSRRPYKEPLPLAQCLAILEEGQGNHFDPEVVTAFSRLAEELYLHFKEHTAEQLRDEMKAIIERYFDVPAASAMP